MPVPARLVGLFVLALAFTACGDGPTGVKARVTYETDAAAIVVMNYTDETIYAVATDEVAQITWHPTEDPRLAIPPGGTGRIEHDEILGVTAQTQWVGVQSWHVVSTSEGRRARMHPIIRVRIRPE